MRTIEKGFTLVELLVVISVIGALAAIAVFTINPNGQYAKARDAQRKSDVQQIKRVLELFYNDYGQYPCWNSGSNCTAAQYSPADFANGSNPKAYPGWNSSYIVKIPSDPTGGNDCASGVTNSCTSGVGNPSYLYVSGTGAGSPQAYTIFFNLENCQDPAVTAAKPLPNVLVAANCHAITGGYDTCKIPAALSGSACNAGGKAQYNDWINVP